MKCSHVFPNHRSGLGQAACGGRFSTSKDGSCPHSLAVVVEYGKSRRFGVRPSLASASGTSPSVSALVSAPDRQDDGGAVLAGTLGARVAWPLHDAQQHAAFAKSGRWESPPARAGSDTVAGAFPRSLRARVVISVWPHAPSGPSPHRGGCRRLSWEGGGWRWAAPGSTGKGGCERCKVHLVTDDHLRVDVRGRARAESGRGRGGSHLPGGQARAHRDHPAKPGPGIFCSQKDTGHPSQTRGEPERSYHASVRNLSADTCFPRTDRFGVLDTRAGAVRLLIGQTHLSTRYFGLP